MNTKPANEHPSSTGPRRAALSLALLYAALAGLWIIGSDTLAAFLFPAEQLTTVQTWKGWFFVAMTALLLGLYTRHLLAALTGALRHKEALLKENLVVTAELHHRIKNNLQLISSLIALGRTENGDDCRMALDSLSRKITTMGIIHNIVYEEKNLDRIRTGEFLTRLADAGLTGTHRIVLPEGENPPRLPVDTLIPLGMLLEEFLAHVTTAPGMLTVRIRFREEGTDTVQCLLELDGPVSIPAETGTAPLTELLTRQLQGTLRHLPHRDACTAIELIIPTRKKTDPV